MPRYFLTPDYAVAMNPKCGSSSISRRIIQVFHPDLEQTLQSASYPANKGPDDIQCHLLCPSTTDPELPVVVMVREPIDRFLSGIAYLGISVEDAIDSIQNGTLVRIRRSSQRLLDNVHFKPQERLMRGETHLFRFPQHVDQAHAFLGIGPALSLNQGTEQKPVLTTEQRNIVLQAYADDVALYNSFTTPNYTVMAPVPTVADELEEE